ncbi:MAG: AAA family ATPase [Eubacterium sp.]|nr:AAA family ATPase [Eubacterium sp.]
MNKKEIMTAHNASAPTDEKQSLPIPCNDTIAKNNENVKSAETLDTFTMSELYNEEYTYSKDIVEGLFPVGIYLIAAPPKVGKSRLSLQLAYSVATGEDFWSKPVSQGSVLYLSLEDTKKRLQRRSYQMFDINDTPNLHFAIVSKTISDGLVGQLRAFLEEHNDTKLIIIDTFQKVCDAYNDKVSYSKDYRIITVLKELTDEYNICLLLIHHTRKQEADDCFDMISGTNGLFGAVDGAYVLSKDKKNINRIELNGISRDLPPIRLVLQSNNHNLKWVLIEEKDMEAKQEEGIFLIDISKIVNESNTVWKGTASELSALLTEHISINNITKKLKLTSSDLSQKCNVKYELGKNHEGRYIILRWVGQ